MDRFRELSTFVTVADCAGFNAAARQLGISPPSVTRLIGGLEERLGARLFTRTTRRLALTEAGTRFLEDARRLLDDLEAAEAAAAGLHQAPRGVLRITAPVLFGEMHVAPILRDFLDLHPEVSASALFLDRVVDLIDEGMDIAIRIADLPDSGLTAIRLGSVRRVLVAAPAYVARHGTPATPDDLAGHALISTSALDGPGTWRFGAQQVRIAPRLRVTSIRAVLDAAAAGWGIARPLSYQVADDLAAGRLVELLPGADSREIPVHIVHAEGRAAAARTRAFIDFTVPRLRMQAAWSGASGRTQASR